MIQSPSDPPDTAPAQRPDDTWYIVRQADGHCDLCPAADLDAIAVNPLDPPKTWGPFVSQTEAIARRVGLIRAGHCQPH